MSLRWFAYRVRHVFTCVAIAWRLKIRPSWFAVRSWWRSTYVPW